MSDYTLFDYDPGDNEPQSIEARFNRFHKNNPIVYDTLVRLAFQAVDRGKVQIGIGALWERMRWELWMETTGDEFRLNNNFRSRYARLIMEEEPALAGVFELRRLRSA